MEMPIINGNFLFTLSNLFIYFLIFRTRNLDSGSISADFHPSDNNVIVEWKDQGASGDWTTKAEVPLDNSASTKISVSRKWNH